MRNKLYYHFYIPDASSHWQLLLYEQLDCIEGSGLQYQCDVEICVSSNQKNYKKLQEIIKSYSFLKSTWFDTSIEDNKNHYEGTTLIKLYDECCSYDNVGYIHSKGITSLSKQTNRWRKVMEYGVIEKWKDNIHALDEKRYDVSGICWDFIGNHFSGNFWWAKSSYIKTLPRPAMEKWPKQIVPIDAHWSSRFRYEGWIGLENPKANNIHQHQSISRGIIINEFPVDIKRKTILNFPNEKTFSYS
jgi:hypothetical protein